MSVLAQAQRLEDSIRGTVRWSVLLAASSGLAALFMFLTHVVAVRVLTTEEYGEFSSAIALIGIIGVGATSVQAVTVKAVKNAVPRQAEFSTIQEVALLIAVSLIIGLSAAYLIHVGLVTAVLLGAWVPAAVMIARANGEIQGRELQSLLHGSTATITLAALVVSGILSIFSSSVSSFLSGRLLVTVVFAGLLLRLTKVPPHKSISFLHRGLMHSTLLVSTMWFAANLDVLVGRAVLDSTEVGEIAVAAMLVNSVLLLPGLISAVVYPKVITHRWNTPQLWRLLWPSLGLAGALQIAISLVLALSSSSLVDWLAGPDHEQAKSLVVRLSLAYIPIGVAIVASQFVLGLGSLSDSVLFMLITGLGTIVLTTAASDAKSFISILQLVAWILAGVLVVQALWKIRKIAHEEAQM